MAQQQAQNNGVLQQMREDVQAIRESAPAKMLDKVIAIADQALGTSGKAWLANGLDELRQAVALGPEQVQAGNNPGLWGSITTGEATAERLDGEEHGQALTKSYDLPDKMSLAEMREYAKERSQEAQQKMERGPEQDRGQERGGPEM